MITAEQKRKEHIVEYLLYMWQVEDLIRAAGGEMSNIRRLLIDSCDRPEDVKEQMSRRYEELIEQMRSEGVMEKGHIQSNRHLLATLEELHRRLLRTSGETLYGAVYYKTLPCIIQLRAKSGGVEMSELETCITALYGYLLLRQQNREIAPETLEGIKQINTFLSFLAEKYREDAPTSETATF